MFPTTCIENLIFYTCWSTDYQTLAEALATQTAFVSSSITLASWPFSALSNCLAPLCSLNSTPTIEARCWASASPNWRSLIRLVLGSLEKIRSAAWANSTNSESCSTKKLKLLLFSGDVLRRKLHFSETK